MRVGLFVTCLVDLMRPSIGFAALRLLEAGGATVVVPPTQTCCGQPAYNSGDRADARALAAKVVAETKDKPGTITKLEKKEEREQPDLLYDLTSLQRHANTLFGFSARRTLGAAQRLYEEHKAITYPRTNSRFLTSELIGEIKPTASMVGKNAEYTKAANYVVGLDRLPLGRVRSSPCHGS